MTTEWDDIWTPAAWWGELDTTMQGSRTRLGALAVTAFGESVRPAATAFVEAWRGYADESVEICAGVAEALTTMAVDVDRTDAEVAQGFEGLDGSIGEAG